MSAYMVNDKTTTIIARYMAHFGQKISSNSKLLQLELPDRLKEILRDRGCFLGGELDPRKVQTVLFEENKKAIIARYGELSDDPSAVGEFNENLSVDFFDSSCRVWLSNLFTVCRCYRYQICEGDFRDNPFWNAFNAWVDSMAYILAFMVVEEVRPKVGSKNYKYWEEF